MGDSSIAAYIVIKILNEHGPHKAAVPCRFENSTRGVSDSEPRLGATEPLSAVHPSRHARPPDSGNRFGPALATVSNLRGTPSLRKEHLRLPQLVLRTGRLAAVRRSV